MYSAAPLRVLRLIALVRFYAAAASCAVCSCPLCVHACVRAFVRVLPSARALEGPVVGEFDAAARRYMAKERQRDWR